MRNELQWVRPGSTTSRLPQPELVEPDLSRSDQR